MASTRDRLVSTSRDGWVTEDSISDFATKSEGLFIWAATVCEVLRDKHTFNPKATLHTILYEEHEFGLPAEEKMGQLFDRILNSCKWTDKEFCQAFQQVIGTVATAKVPLSCQTLQQFCPDVPIERILDHLMPVVTGSDDTSQGVKFSHLSFLDYLISRTRTKEPYYINPQMHESRLALLCLKALTTDLKVGSPGTGYLDSDAEGIPSMAEEGIAQHVSYACRFWVDHSVEIRPDDDKLGAFLGCAATFLPGDNLIRWAELSTAIGQFVSLKSFGVWYLRVSKQEIWGGNNDAIQAYAEALFKLSLRLRYMVRLEETLSVSDEEVAIRRQLATNRAVAFCPDLARSLNNLSLLLYDVSRSDEALLAVQEALTTQRQLAIDRPEAFLSILATYLGTVSICLDTLGLEEQALSTDQEALTIRRQLVIDRPAVFLPDLAKSLNNTSICLSDLGRDAEALAAIQEAVDIYRQLTIDRPATFLPDLVKSLINFSLRLPDVARLEEAISAIQAALTIYRQLATDCPAAFLPDFAMCLHILSYRQWCLGHHEEALVPIREAIAIRQQLAKDRPAVFSKRLVESLRNYSKCLSSLGREGEAQAVISDISLMKSSTS